MSSQRKKLEIAYYTEPFEPIPTNLDTFEALIGYKPRYIMYYDDWSYGLNTPIIDKIAARGQTPIISWQPSVGGGNPSTNLNIIAGTWDTYLKTYANAVKDWRRPLIIRMGHEMNGSGWYQWQTTDFPAMWRHVWQIFKDAGVKNVIWFWSPNVDDQPSYIPLANVFPGVDYVDIVGADGYNWGNPAPVGHTSEWRDFDTIFGSTIDQCRVLASKKPFWIGEISSSDLGGDKGTWWIDVFKKCRDTYAIEELTLFSANKVGEPDFRVNSSAGSLAAWQNYTPAYF